MIFGLKNASQWNVTFDAKFICHKSIVNAKFNIWFLLIVGVYNIIIIFSFLSYLNINGTLVINIWDEIFMLKLVDFSKTSYKFC